MEKRSYRGVSPVVATVLLIAMVIIIALIIFLWFKEVMVDYGEKFGKNVELVCADVNFEADYSGSTLYIKNNGDVPIFKIKMKIFKTGSHETKDLSEDWPELGLNQEQAFSGSINLDEGVNKIILIPVLIANSKKGKKPFVCEEKYGYEIIIQ